MQQAHVLYPPIWRAASGTCSGLSGRQIRTFGAPVSSGRPFVLAGTQHAGGGQVRGLSGLVDAVGSPLCHRRSASALTNVVRQPAIRGMGGRA
jgi:hypothetical protein